MRRSRSTIPEVPVRWLTLVVAAVAFTAAPGAAQDPRLPPLMPEAEEIALARTAAPAALSDAADIYVLRRGGHVRVVEGTNGAACMVARDHPESLYPICYDAAAAATVMQAELFSQRLRESGIRGDRLRAELDAAFAAGELRAPETVAVAYMMSPYQVLYAGEDGRRVGRWHAHLMIYGPGLSREGIGFGGYPDGNLQVGDETGHMPSLVVFTEWAVSPEAEAEGDAGGKTGGDVDGYADDADGTPAPATTLKQLAFMAGCWRGEFGDGGSIEEFYSRPSGGLMLGTTRFMRGGRVVQFEFTRVREDEDGVFLTPFPNGQRSEHDFRLTRVEGRRAVFEAPQHDFPNRILYWENPDGSHTARIDGGEGDPRSQEWVMMRVACPQSLRGAGFGV